MSESIIHLPRPTELLAPPPQKQGVIHTYFYTGERAKPVFFRGRPLWRVGFRYGIVEPETAWQVREEMQKLFELGEGLIYLPFPFGKVPPPVVRGSVAVASVNASAQTITYPTGLSSKLMLDHPVQLGRYTLFPLPRTDVILDESGRPLYDAKGRKLLQETGQAVVRYPNMPDLAQVPAEGGQYEIAQGEGVNFIRVRPADIEMPEFTVVSRYMTRVGEIEFTEVP